MAATANPPAGASAGELVRWAFDVLNTHDVTPLRGFWTAETVERFPDRTCHGPDQIAEYFEAMFRAVPDFHMRVVALAEQGEDVFVQWHLTGTHRGDVLGVAGTGRPLAIDGIDHFVIRDGVVVSNFVIVDQMQFSRQIGLMPADGSPADRALKQAFNARTALARRFGR